MKVYRWAAPGDVNAFAALVLDNVANLVLAMSLLTAGFGFPAIFVMRYMIPGTALGVLVGDLIFTWLAFRLARQTGCNDVTAMPLGLDTPSTIGMVLFVLGPAFLDARHRGLEEFDAARFSWQIGTAAVVSSGVVKLICSLGSGWLRRSIPRAGLLGSLAAIALVLIGFLPLLEIIHSPIVGLISLAVIFGSLIARLRLPGNIPGALAALLVSLAAYLLLMSAGLDTSHGTAGGIQFGFYPPWPTLNWLRGLTDSLPYLPVVIPFAIATVIGGIDCTESAAAGGDEYYARDVIAVEGFATLVAGICGGVIQTTPYIGHPAYKAMGGRAAYTLAAALFIGGLGIFGCFAPVFELLPKAAIFPILVFVGLEITAQSFHATPSKHFPAVALACLPALAYLILIFVDPLIAPADAVAQLTSTQREQIESLRVLAGGFIITGLLWAALLTSLIDRRFNRAACYGLTAGAASAFGVIHSPFAGNPMFLPWNLHYASGEWQGRAPLEIATGYLCVAALLALWAKFHGAETAHRDVDQQPRAAGATVANSTRSATKSDPDGI